MMGHQHYSSMTTIQVLYSVTLAMCREIKMGKVLEYMIVISSILL